MAVRPVALNATIACLFAVGSALFAAWIGARVRQRGRSRLADGVTYFIGSIFSLRRHSHNCYKPQTPAMTNVDVNSAALGRRLDVLGMVAA